MSFPRPRLGTVTCQPRPVGQNARRGLHREARRTKSAPQGFCHPRSFILLKELFDVEITAEVCRGCVRAGHSQLLGLVVGPVTCGPTYGYRPCSRTTWCCNAIWPTRSGVGRTRARKWLWCWAIRRRPPRRVPTASGASCSDAMPAGGPHKIVIEGKNRIAIDDVLVGEVWVCSGQSNMQMSRGCDAGRRPGPDDGPLSPAANDHRSDPRVRRSRKITSRALGSSRRPTRSTASRPSGTSLASRCTRRWTFPSA